MCMLSTENSYWYSSLSSDLWRGRVSKTRRLLSENGRLEIFLKKQEVFSQNGSPQFIHSRSQRQHYFWSALGAIIGDGDRKRPPFLVLGLAPWYGTIFLFLEQIVPSPAAHARTCCEDFCGCRAVEMASEIPEIFYTFGSLLNSFM